MTGMRNYEAISYISKRCYHMTRYLRARRDHCRSIDPLTRRMESRNEFVPTTSLDGLDGG